MSQQQRVVALLQQACSLLGDSSSNDTVNSNVRSSVRQLFAPYRSAGQGRRRIQQPPALADEPSTWTHRFFCLSKNDQDVTPSRQERRILQDAGLGEMKITMPKTNRHVDFRNKLSEFFPKLKEAGGVQLLRTAVGCRSSLEVIRVPPEGYSAQYLADRCGLGQAMIYVRPLQTSLSVSPLKSESGMEVFHEKCLKCGEDVPLMDMEKHLEDCGNSEYDLISQADLPPPSKKPRTDTTRPICGFACVTAGPSIDAALTMTAISDEGEIPCPICGVQLPKKELQIHAATCGENSAEHEETTINMYVIKIKCVL